MRDPEGRSLSFADEEAIKQSEGSSRGGTAAKVNPSIGSVGKSLRLWTATSQRPSRSARWISLVNRPTPPDWPNGVVVTSPVVVIFTNSTW